MYVPLLTLVAFVGHTADAHLMVGQSGCHGRKSLAVYLVGILLLSLESLGGNQPAAAVELLGEVFVVHPDEGFDVFHIFVIGVEEEHFVVCLRIDAPPLEVLDARGAYHQCHRIHKGNHLLVEPLLAQLLIAQAYSLLEPRVFPHAGVPSLDGVVASVAELDGEPLAHISHARTVVPAYVKVPDGAEVETLVGSLLIYIGTPEAVRVGTYLLHQVPVDERGGVGVLAITALGMGKLVAIESRLKLVDIRFDIVELARVDDLGLGVVNAYVASLLAREVESVGGGIAFGFQKVATADVGGRIGHHGILPCYLQPPLVHLYLIGNLIVAVIAAVQVKVDKLVAGGERHLHQFAHT